MRGNPIVTIICWIVYFGLTVGIILLDRSIQKKKAEAQGSVDFMERSPTSYLVLALFCGPAPLIVYFGVTRKSAIGWLMGFGAAFAVYTVTFVVAFALTLAFGVTSPTGIQVR